MKDLKWEIIDFLEKSGGRQSLFFTSTIADESLWLFLDQPGLEIQYQSNCNPLRTEFGLWLRKLNSRTITKISIHFLKDDEKYTIDFYNSICYVSCTQCCRPSSTTTATDPEKVLEILTKLISPHLKNL